LRRYRFASLRIDQIPSASLVVESAYPSALVAFSRHHICKSRRWRHGSPNPAHSSRSSFTGTVKRRNTFSVPIMPCFLKVLLYLVALRRLHFLPPLVKRHSRVSVVASALTNHSASRAAVR